MTQRLLDIAGIGADRLHVAWVSSAEAQRFVEVATGVTDSIKSQGPLDAGKYALALDAARRTVNSEIVRWFVGKEVRITTKGDVYGRPWDTERFEKSLMATLEREYEKNLILSAIKDGAVNPRAIRDKVGLDLRRISYLLADLEKTSAVAFQKMEDKKPVFAALG
jgi:hypothetical protein